MKNNVQKLENRNNDQLCYHHIEIDRPGFVTIITFPLNACSRESFADSMCSLCVNTEMIEIAKEIYTIVDFCDDRIYLHSVIALKIH